MKNVAELLREADPVGDEPMPSFEQRELQRRDMLDAAASTQRSHQEARPRIALLAAAAFAILVATLLGVRIWSPFVTNVHAAVRFEVRLAEENPAPGLLEAKVPGSNRSVYLYDQIVVSNGDISAARLVPGNGAAQYAVSVEFDAAGTAKMQAATANHIGKLMAILLDGEVVMAPVIRSPIAGSAMITGNLTKVRAEKIVSGITTHR